MQNNSLLIISHTPHYKKDGKYYGWGATIRELDELADLFDEVMHIAPIHEGLPNSQNSPYTNDKIIYRTAVAAGGVRLIDKLSVITSWFRNYSIISKEIGSYKYIHLRCPANISLLALLMLLPKKKRHARVWIKYAGNWGAEKIPLGYRVQRFVIKNFFKRAFITINGTFDDTPAQFRDFLNPCLYGNEVQNEHADKILTIPVQLLFVGAFETYKGTDTLLKIVEYLKGKVDFKLSIVGDGGAKDLFLKNCTERGLNDHVDLLGWKNKEDLKELYKKAHFVVLPSKGEGWPKVLSEGMAYGAVPVSSNVSCIPQVLADINTGACFSWDDHEGFGDFILKMVDDPNQWHIYSQNAMNAAHRFTYTAYKKRIKEEFLDQA